MIDKRPRTAREVAAFSLFSMAEQQAWSDGALHYYLDRAGRAPRDAALAARLLYGTVQNELLCDFYLRSFSSVRLKKLSPRVHACLRMGIYQLALLDRIPPHAAVSETVELVRRYCHANDRTVAYANGVLRAAACAAAEKKLPVLDCPDKQSYYALWYSHPEWLVRRLLAQYGQKLTQTVLAANNAQTPVSVRVNTLRCTAQQAADELSAAGLAVQPHAAVPNILLCTGGDVAALPAFTQGRITVQDAASAVAASVAAPRAGDFAIDCCAAPGGKSFAMAAHMQGQGKLIACDIYAHKLDKIRQGAARLGIDCIEAVQADATALHAPWQGQADVVLCDVPCSGLGIIRKKPEIRYKDEQGVQALPALQARILQNCAQYVKAGGTLVYSTCTILESENEAVVRAFLTKNTDFCAVSWTHPVCGEVPGGMVTLLPSVHDTDGFFIAKLRKKQ